MIIVWTNDDWVRSRIYMRRLVIRSNIEYSETCL